jgi:hypothetical protein
VINLQPFISDKISELKQVCTLSEMPSVDPGPHCDKPYTCDFYGYCWQNVEENIVHDREHINKEALKAFVNRLEYPLYFMDFETWMMAVPEYDGHWPYRQVPFQFSVHRQACPNAPLEHFEYLAPVSKMEDSLPTMKKGEPGEFEIPNSNFGIPPDPCREFIERLLPTVGNRGSIVVYNAAFENTRLRELKEDYPEYSSRISDLQSRIVDLMSPFRSRHLCLPAMNGSYSIKAVLPALVPEMNYEVLAINNGADASASFYQLRYETDEQKVKETREALLKYCEMDTLAMVRVLEQLKTYK